MFDVDLVLEKGQVRGLDVNLYRLLIAGYVLFY